MYKDVERGKGNCKGKYKGLVGGGGGGGERRKGSKMWLNKEVRTFGEVLIGVDKE